MREVLSVQELFAAMIRKGTVLICLGLVFAILLGGWQCLTLREKAQDPNNAPEKIEARYQEAMDAYLEEKAELEENLEKAQVKLERQQVYMENSIQMHIDPYNVGRCSIMVSISGLQLNNDVPLEQADYMIEKVQKMYQEYWKLADLYTEMDERNCATAEEKYMREVMDIEVTAGGTLTIKAVSNDLDLATRQAYAIYDILMDMKPMIEKSTCAHELVMLDSTSKRLVLEGIESRQTTEENLTNTYITNVENLQKQISELEEPQKEKSYGMEEILTGTAKRAIIGFVLGLFLGAAWALCLALMGERLQNKKHMEDMLQVPYMGSVAKKGGIFQRMANRLTGEPQWRDPEDAYNFLVQNIGSVVKKEEKVVILTTLNAEKFEKTSKDLILAAEAACDGIVCLNCADRNAQVISALAECKKILLAERADVSKYQQVLSVMELAKRMDAAVVGFVTV